MPTHSPAKIVTLLDFCPFVELGYPIGTSQFDFFNGAKGRGLPHGFIIAVDILFAASEAINVLWFLTGRRFGFSDPLEDEEEDRKRESYPTGTLSLAAGGTQSPGVAATPGGELGFPHPSFPDEGADVVCGARF
ncbi:hypothetical protein BS47DRAFT_1396393 [Hydnum rufescens UP504]|uniref:Uncharacterized protein n=1 Tax=Hydnum rufescens UP504 TaxID=1448309 RepID=A0A9P6AQG0_9AGAM|nr:hypothetical protein BS47DRAFT_1396393 [Hydnum rufescens UP504]